MDIFGSIFSNLASSFGSIFGGGSGGGSTGSFLSMLYPLIISFLGPTWGPIALMLIGLISGGVGADNANNTTDTTTPTAVESQAAALAKCQTTISTAMSTITGSLDTGNLGKCDFGPAAPTTAAASCMSCYNRYASSSGMNSNNKQAFLQQCNNIQSDCTGVTTDTGGASEETTGQWNGPSDVQKSGDSYYWNGSWYSGIGELNAARKAAGFSELASNGSEKSASSNPQGISEGTMKCCTGTCYSYEGAIYEQIVPIGGQCDSPSSTGFMQCPTPVKGVSYYTPCQIK